MSQPQNYLEALKNEALRIAQEETEKVRKALKSAVAPGDFEKITANLQRSADQIFQQKLAESGDTIDCKAGCSFCCYIQVDAHAWEIFRLADYIQKKFTKQKVDAVHARAKAMREKTKGMTVDERRAVRIACPLLQDGRCSAYEARPLVCRNHHSPYVSLCESAFNHPDSVGTIATVNEIRLSVGAVLGFSPKAFECAGYDATCYDLSAGLDEALSNPKCYRRWREKKRAFSADVAAKEPKDTGT